MAETEAVESVDTENKLENVKSKAQSITQDLEPFRSIPIVNNIITMLEQSQNSIDKVQDATNPNHDLASKCILYGQIANSLPGLSGSPIMRSISGAASWLGIGELFLNKAMKFSAADLANEEGRQQALENIKEAGEKAKDASLDAASKAKGLLGEAFDGLKEQMQKTQLLSGIMDSLQAAGAKVQEGFSVGGGNKTDKEIVR